MAGFPKEDWWIPDQIALVEDRSRRWDERVFQPSDAIAYPVEEGTLIRQRGDDEVEKQGTIIPGGWDHEHCFLCYQTISPHPADEPFGYTDGQEWICRSCYVRFILPRRESQESPAAE